ncbi:MAG: hypothetical protein AAGI88_07900 [Pseudomonadota bacterium]
MLACVASGTQVSRLTPTAGRVNPTGSPIAAERADTGPPYIIEKQRWDSPIRQLRGVIRIEIDSAVTALLLSWESPGDPTRLQPVPVDVQ